MISQKENIGTHQSLRTLNIANFKRKIQKQIILGLLIRLQQKIMENNKNNCLALQQKTVSKNLKLQWKLILKHFERVLQYKEISHTTLSVITATQKLQQFYINEKQRMTKSKQQQKVYMNKRMSKDQNFNFKVISEYAVEELEVMKKEDDIAFTSLDLETARIYHNNIKIFKAMVRQ